MPILKKYYSIFLFLSVYLWFGDSVYGDYLDSDNASPVINAYLNKQGEKSHVAVPPNTLYKVFLDKYGTVPIERLLEKVHNDFFYNTQMQGDAKKIIFALTEKAEVKEKTFSEKLLLLGSGADDYDIRHPRLDQLKTLVQLFCQAGLGDKTTKDLLVPIVYNAAKYPDHTEYLRQAALLFTELPNDSQSTRQRVDEHIDFVVSFLRDDQDHITAALNKSEYRDYIQENTYFDSDDNSEERWEALRQSCCEIYNASDIAPSAMTASREGGNGDNPTSVSSGKAGGGTGMASGIKTVLSTALCTLLSYSAGVGAVPAPATTGESATSPSNASDWRGVCPDSITDKECARILREECEYGLNNNYLGVGCQPKEYNCLSYNKTKTGTGDLCIPDNWTCDDEKDCSAESSDSVNDDESSRFCDRCQSNGYYKCGRRCIPDSYMCDGCNDCLHGSDEKPPFCTQYRLHQHVQRQCPNINGSAGIDCVQGFFQQCLDKIPAFSDEVTEVPRVKPVCQKKTLPLFTQPRTTQARTTGKTQRLKPTKPPSNQPVSKDNRSVIKTRENNASMANATFSTMTDNTTRVPVSGGRSTIRPTRNASGLSSGNSNESQASGQSGFSTAAIVGTTIPVLIAAGAIGGALYWQRDNISQFLSSRFPGFKPFNLGDRTHKGNGYETVELTSAGGSKN